MLPNLPGVYRFLDDKGCIIYVGKAKNLRKRVSSYFVNSREHSPKVRILVQHIVDIKHIVVDSETDALLLENSLIKTHQPRYNILLKDDKTYPWIVVRNEHFPRVESTRSLRRDGSQYFGPYGSIMMQRAILEFIRDVVPLRTCKLALDPQSIARHKYAVCLNYHIGNCKAPCIGEQSPEEYDRMIQLVTSILKGDLRPVRLYLETEMDKAAQNLQFELAHRFKQRLDALDNYAGKSVIVSAKIIDTDLFSLLKDGDDTAWCNFVRIRHGSIIAVSTHRIALGVESSDEQILAHAIQRIVESVGGGELAREVIVPCIPAPALIFDGVTFTVPKRGEKFELMEFSLRNARIYRAEQLKNMEIHNPERHVERLMAAMQKELHLQKPPRHIECFDNSNLQGTNPVAACVVFRDGKPARKEYRHFNVKTVVGADDFATMREIITRRYVRMLDEKQPLPDLVVVDGGKGQLSSAATVFKELGIYDRVPLVGLAERLEEIYFPNDPMPYYLNRTGEPLKVVCYIRDEAHRFGITFHRKKRSQNFIHSELDDIQGIGAKTIETLMHHFRTVAKIKAAHIEELSGLVGNAKAKKIKDFFKKDVEKFGD